MIVWFAFQSRAPAERPQGSEPATKPPVDLQKLDQILQSMVDELYSRAATSGAKGLQTKCVRFEGIGYESLEGVMEGSSALGALLQKRLELALSRNSVVLSPEESDGAKGFFGTVVRGGFRVVKSATHVTLRLLDGNTGNTLSEVSREFGLDLIPGLSRSDVEPPNGGEAKALGALVKKVVGGLTSDFKLRLSTDEGSFGTYTEGDKLTIILESEKDCYVRVYHVSWQERKLTLIFPNKSEQDGVLKASEVRRVPGELLNYSFEVSKPYGVDALVAVASLEPFGDENEVAAQWSGRSEPEGATQIESTWSDTSQVATAPEDTTQLEAQKGIERVGAYLERSNIDEQQLQTVVAKGLIIKEDTTGQQSAATDAIISTPLRNLANPTGRQGRARATCYFVTVERLFQR
jgi:hypothetical protein